mmetsp:Transcript_5511/g.14388  ORF Transcript_5511/g.14388 Transcript_5511/m.14388 type:complete len:200 (-) Transcript_5511:1862-2461(-)
MRQKAYKRVDERRHCQPRSPLRVAREGRAHERRCHPSVRHPRAPTRMRSPSWTHITNCLQTNLPKYQIGLSFTLTVAATLPPHYTPPRQRLATTAARRLLYGPRCPAGRLSRAAVAERRRDTPCSPCPRAPPCLRAPVARLRARPCSPCRKNRPAALPSRPPPWPPPLRRGAARPRPGRHLRWPLVLAGAARARGARPR